MAETPVVVVAPVSEIHCCYCEWTEYVFYQKKKTKQKRGLPPSLALKEIAASHSDVEIVYPVHLNPNVQEPVQRILGNCSSVHLIEPLNYLPFVWLMDCCYLIITDSGGVQEETPSLGKPILVMRDTTERPEASESGTNPNFYHCQKLQDVELWRFELWVGYGPVE